MVVTTASSTTYRRHDLDNLRTFLTTLVIVHHTSNCYGGPGNGPYKSGLIAAVYPSSRLPLFAFNAVNQSFFMGLFFWISGRVSASSLARIDADAAKTRWSFVRSKILRLGLPAVFYTLALEPIVLLAGHSSWDIASVKQRLAEYFATLDRINGPVWYTANLLLFDLAAALQPSSQRGHPNPSKASKNGPLPKPPFFYFMARKFGWIAAAVGNFLIRIYYPIGVTIKPSALQVGFASQYVLAYIMGYASSYFEPTFTGPFTKMLPLTSNKSRGEKDGGPASNPSHIRSHLVRAVLISISLIPLPQVPQLFRAVEADLQALGASGIYGGWNLTSLLYTIWNETSFIMVGPALATFFYCLHNKPAASRFFQSRDSYGAYLSHMLVSTIIEKGFDWVLMSGNGVLEPILGSGTWKAFGPVVMTGAVGAINIVASFAMAKFILDGIPILRRII